MSLGEYIVQNWLLFVIWFIIWICFAIPCSVLWGIYGCIDDSEDDKKWAKHICIKRIGVFLSEFIGSFAGWCCLYIFTVRFASCPLKKLGSFDMFLIIGAVVCMAGYAYKIVDLIDNLKKPSKGKDVPQ